MTTTHVHKRIIVALRLYPYQPHWYLHVWLRTAVALFGFGFIPLDFVLVEGYITDMPIRQVATGVHDHEQPKVDIVAVHGLNPWDNVDHAFDTWRKPHGEGGILWLRDSLSHTLARARIFLYEYNSSPAFGSTKERFVHQANDLLENVRIERRRDPKRPLIFVGHSLGGILIKQALVNAHNNPNYTPIREATCGLVFFGTPHAGGNQALVTLGKTCARIVMALSTAPSNDIMQALQHGSLFSDILQENWRHQLTSYKIVSFYEGIGSIVPRLSAVIGLPGDLENQVRLDADHSNLCRFDVSIQKDRDNLRLVEANVEELYELAITQIEPRHFSSATTKTPISKVDYEHEVLRGLYFEEMYYRHDEIREAHKRTFEWVQDNPGPGFVSWLRQSHGIYWIRGKPGSGKSTLMKLIYDDPQTHENLVASYGVETLLIAGFFFHDRGSFLQKSLYGVLRAILYQILKRFKVLIPIVFPVAAENDGTWVETRRQQQHWTHQELERALLTLVGQSKVVGNVCLFIDALDEYNGSHLEFVELVKTVAASSSNSALKIKFCVSSRPVNVFKDGFEQAPGFQIHDWTKGDIPLYVTKRLQEHPRLMPQSYGKGNLSIDADDLRNEVVRRALGVFLWVKLVVDDLLQGLTDGDTIFELQERLAALPDDLEGLYRRILENIARSYLLDTFHFFDLVECALTPLSLLQFARATEPYAAAITCPIGEVKQSEILRLCDDMERRLRSRCGGLLELQIKDRSHVKDQFQDSLESLNSSQVDPSTTVQFLHRTVRDFLRVPKNGRHGFGIKDPGPTHDPFVSLMRGTLHALKSSPRRRNYRTPECDNMVERLLVYANNAEASTGETQTDILDELDRAETKIWRSSAEHSFDSWPTLFLNQLGHALVGPTAFLAIAVVAGLVLYVSEKIKTQKVDFKSHSRQSLLLCAVTPDHLAPKVRLATKQDMVKLLVQSGADPMHTYRGVTAWKRFLKQSSFWGPLAGENLRIMQLLLEYGADPNVDMHWGITPLHQLIRSFSDYTNPEVATFLRELMARGADSKAKDGWGESVLELAQRRSSALTAFLLENQPAQGILPITVIARRIRRRVHVMRRCWIEKKGYR